MYLRNSLLLKSICAVSLITTMAFAEKPKVSESAREHFKAGIAYLDEPTGAKYEDAYREFHAAYAASPSYKILNNIALCALYLERDGEAIDAYERYLAEAPKDEIPPQKRAQLDSDLKRLKAGVVKLSLKTTPSDATLIDERSTSDGKTVVNRYAVTGGALSLGIHPGSHKLTLKADGFTTQTWEFEAAPASSQSHDFALVAENATDAAKQNEGEKKPTSEALTEPPAPPKRSTPTMVYVGAAATGLFAASATVTGLMAMSKKGDVVDLNKTGLEPDKARSASDDAKLYALFCDISIGAAVVAGATTAYFYFSAPKVTKPITASRWQVAPVISPNLAGMGVSGNF